MANKNYDLAHTKWMCKYHIVFTPKYRRENYKVVNEVVLKNFLPQVNEESIGRFVKLRNSKTHSGTVEWGENAKIYKALMVIVYSNLFRYIGMPDDVIQSVLSDLF